MRSKAIVQRSEALPASSPVIVACGADNGFAKPLAVTLYSLLRNFDGTRALRVFVVDGGIDSRNRERIDAIMERFGRRAEWVTPRMDSVSELATTERFPTSVYLRLLLPSVLPPDVAKVIYLDSDLVVDANVGELWDTDLRGKPLLAVQDEGAPTVGSPWGLANYKELGLFASTKYFNSGVLVFDLTQWRERGFSDRIIRYISKHADQMRFGEQDAMNAILAREWQPLESRWNQLVSPWEGHDGRQYQRGILHFVSRFKPWNPDGAHWTNFIYDRYLRESGWYGPLRWWTYYVALLVKRQHVLHVRAERALQR